MAERRELSFSRLDDVMADVDRLRAGHETVGQWTLGQILLHLVAAIRASMSARSDSAPTSREQHVAQRLFFRHGRFPEGLEVPHPALIPQADADASAQADALRAAIHALAAVDRPLAIHPRLGEMTKEQWLQFHCIHCAHHLSFVLPASQPDETVDPPESAG